MEFQLNPNAAEFIPGSPPKHQIKLSSINDSLVAGSPLKSMAMDDIKIPSQKEFDAEISVRPRDMEEEKDSPNGDHITHSDYDFYTERQKVIGAPIGLDESEISSTKAEYGDESNMSSLYTTDLHKTGISTIEESFGESECDIYNRDNPMTMSYTPCDFKAAFKKEVDLNAVHDLSDGDLEDENCSFEVENVPPRSPIQSSDIEHPMESNGFLNEESSDRVQSFSGSLEGEATFLKFGDSEEPKTEFMQVELERHQSSPIDPGFGKDDVLMQEKESHSMEDSEDIVSATQAENEQMETHKEANYVEDEKDIVVENDTVTSETEQVIEKPVEIATDLIQSEIPQETSFQDHNFLSSTIHEAPKSASSIENTPKSMSPVPMEHIEKPLETDMVSPIENLEQSTDNDFKTILTAEATAFQPKFSSFDPFASGEPLSSDLMKASNLEEPMDLMSEPIQSEQRVEEPSFIPTVTSESASDERPTESLLDFNDGTTTEMPIKEHIEEEKIEEYPLPTLERIAEKASHDIDEPVCLFDTKQQAETEIRENVEMAEALDNLVEKTEELNIADVEKVNEMCTLNLSESIQEFTGLEKELEPKNVTLEETPITDQPTIEDKITEEVVEHKEPVVQEMTDEIMIHEGTEEDIAEYKDMVEPEKEEITMPSKTVDIVEPADDSEVPITLSSNIETEVSTNIIESAITPADTMEIETPIDTAEIATPVDTAEIAMPTDTAETAAPVDIAEKAIPVDTIEIATPTDTVEVAAPADSTEITAPVDSAEIATPAETIEIAVPTDIAEVATLADMAKAVTTAHIVQAEAPTNIVETINLVDTTTTTTKTVEIVETADTAKIAEISEPIPSTQVIEEEKPIDSVKPVESKVEEAVEATTALAAGAAVAAAAATATAVGVVTAAATSTSKAKAKPTAKTTKPGTTTKATPKSTPTSPSKSISSTTRSTITATTTKKSSATPATRPKQLDTAAAKSATSTTAAKATTTKTVSSSKPATSTTRTITATRPTSSVTKTKPPASAKSTSASVEKKSVLNGDVKSLSKGTSAKPASKATATSSVASPASAKTSATKITTISKSSIGATATTTTKPRATSATTAAKSPAKLPSTNSASGTSNIAKTKTTPTSNSASKVRTSLAKSPMIDKQIKETANKQISSMARTTTSAASKITRTSTSSTTVSSVSHASATKRLSSSKSTTATTHSPVKKVLSKVSSGNSSGTKTSSTTTKVKVMQNGTADTAEITKTTIITNIKNEDDVPKKDLSPVVAPTDNQLIVSAD